MKRYSITIADRGDGIYQPRADESPSGQFSSHDDLQAWALKHKATVAVCCPGRGR